jgi:exopolysaccharide biosynthesis protein
MTKKFHILYLIVTIGFFLMPTLTYSCEMKSKKTCCSKEMSSSSAEKMDCCKNINHSKSKDKDHEGGCNGKCGHSNCTTSSFHFSVAFFEIQFKNNNFDFSKKEHNYFNSETNLSSGYYSLWLIPKIS